MQHKYEMGIIGNCEELAYIDKTTNVKWLCWPRFDSSYIFGSLLEDSQGEYYVRPANDNYTSKQFYLENTNILCTEFEGDDYKFRVYDFAPRFLNFDRYYKPLMLFRKVEILSGQPKIKVVCNPVNGKTCEKIHKSKGSNHIRFFGFEEEIRLTTNIPLTYVLEEKEFVATQSYHLVLSWGIPLEGPLETTFESFLDKTKDYWHEWVESCAIPNIYQKEAIRSALVLKLHQYEDTGAIIAAGTTSLPESPGSTRNWDYRYCWIRDSHYTLSALASLSHFEEMEKFSTFIEQVASINPDFIQPVYGIDGRENLEEKEVPLTGYLGNKPVRVGNNAFLQIQNDAYGQILLSIFYLYFDQRLINRKKRFPRELVVRLLNNIVAKMDEPDAGLWEFRNIGVKHCYTYLFHWAGASAALKLGELYKADDVITLAKKVRDESDRIISQFYDVKRGYHSMSPTGDQMDASLLQLINMGYLHPKSQEARLLVENIEKTLKIKDGYLLRYNYEDDFGKAEVAFLICSFWYVEALARIGRVEEAIEYFEILLKSGNHLGLLSEDVAPQTDSQWGNFVQTYSHVGLLHCAFVIDRIVNQHPYL